MAVRVLLIMVVALLLAGCGGKHQASTTTSATTTVAPALADASTEPAVWQSGVTGTALLTAVRAARHAGYDRIVFAFRNHVPGYDVRYVDRPVVADGSGATVPVAGGAVLRIRMEPALDADLSQEGAPATYTGPTRFSPSTAVVAELVRTGGFEAVLTWVAGLDEKRPFRVARLEAPPRLVLDVQSTP
jgi:hypothetical protein